jgi:hypothetical protein
MKGEWSTEKKRIVCLLLLILTLSSCAPLYFDSLKPPREPFRIASLQELPYEELWQGFVFNGEKVGFTCLKIEAIPGSNRFLITSRAHLRIRFLGTEKHITMKSEDTVESDLTLVSFHYEQQIDDKSLIIDGKMERGTFRAIKKGRNGLKAIEKKVDTPLYPVSVINLYPVLKGMFIGSRYRYRVFDPPTQSFLEVSQVVVDFEESKDLVVEPSFKIATSMLNHDVSTWINLRGEAIFELGMGGVLITHKEGENQAKNYLLEKGLSKKDLILDFSLVKTETSLICPRETTYLEVVLDGVAGALSLLQGPGQESFRTGNDTVVYHIRHDPTVILKTDEKQLQTRDFYLYTAATSHLESRDPEIRKTADTIVAGFTSPLEKIRRLTAWVSDTIKDEPVDSTSAVEVLQSRQGECQAHTMLYAALARAEKIPTRLVGGLIYMEGLGFLYHSWAESHVDGWVAVDPTFNQVGVDATHIKLVEGPFWTSTLRLGKVVGRIKATIIAYEAPCKK